jgi:hypothetical protein
MPEDGLPLSLGQHEEVSKFTETHPELDEVIESYFPKSGYTYRSGTFAGTTRYAILKEKNGRYSMQMQIRPEELEPFTSEEKITFLIHTIYQLSTAKRDTIRGLSFFALLFVCGIAVHDFLNLSFPLGTLYGILIYFGIPIICTFYSFRTIMMSFRKSDRLVYELRPNLPQVLRKIGDAGVESERDDYYRRAESLESSRYS